MKARIITLASMVAAVYAACAAEITPSGGMDTSTIQAAIDAAANVSPAGTVTLGTGTFLIDSQLMVTGGVTLVGQGWENTIIKQTATGADKRCATVDGGAAIRQVTLTGGCINGNNASGAGVEIKDGTVSWCRIVNNTAGVSSGSSVYGGGVGFYQGKGQVDHSIIANNLVNSTTALGGGVSVYRPSGAITIDTCLVADNTANAKTAANGKGGGIYLEYMYMYADVTIRNSTIAGNSASGTTLGGGLYVTGDSDAKGTHTILMNNIMAGNTSASVANDAVLSKTDKTSYCLFGLQNEVVGTNCSDGDPLFVDAASGDYHLSSTSPAIGAGTTYTGIGVDLDNVNFADTPAVGCYELSDRAADPVFNPESGVAFYPTTNVTLTCATENATIYYTTDGSTPTDSSTAYSGAIALSATTTIKARAYATGKGPSAIVSATYTYQRPTPQPTEFAKSIEITLTSALATTEITTGVPALVRLKEESDGGIVGFDYDDFKLAKGGDMMFVDSNGNPLPHEVDSWDTTGESLVWVKLPSTAASTKITMYYGKGATSNASSTDVWSDYVGVWHFETATAAAAANSQGTYANSTSTSGIDGNIAEHTVTNETGRFGKGFRTNDSTGQKVGNYNYGGVWVNDSGTGSPVDGGKNFTIAGWFKHGAFDYSWDHIFYKREKSGNTTEVSSYKNAFAIESNSSSGSNPQIYPRGSSGTGGLALNENQGLRDWAYVTFVFNDDKCQVYENGTWKGQATIVACIDNDSPLVFGNNCNVAAGLEGDSAWNGWIDEVRYASGSKEASWIAAEYKAMNTAETDIFEYGQAKDTSSDDPDDPDEPTGVIVPGATAAATRQTIQDAIDAAANLAEPGTVTLDDGLFEIDAQLMVTGGVTLVGQGWDDTVIKQVATTPSAETRCVVVDGGAKVEQVTLTGARVTGGNYTYGGGALVNDGTISWCCITNNSLSTANVKYGGGVHITKGSIDHSIIANNAVSSASGTCGGGGIGIYQPTGKILIDACLVAGNSQSKGQGGAGLFASFLNNHNLLTVRNTTIVDNHASGDGGGIYVTQNGTQPDFALVNCVLADNTAAGEGADQNLALPASCVSGYAAQSSNNLFANGTTALGTDSQSVAGSGSAWFVDAADGDYRLGSGSPAIGAGTTYEGIGVDLDNVAFAEPPSMGCYEYGDLTATPTFTPASGEIFYYTLDVEIACAESGAVIYYTTDGTVPTTSSSLYEGPIELSETMTVKARAYTAGKGPSAVASATYTHEIPEELSFYTPHVEPNSLGADISVTLAHVGHGATVADVYIAWGTDYDHLCTPVLVAENVVAKQRVAYSIDDLENTTHYVFRLSAENDQHRSCTRDGEFTTLSHEYLALSSPTVTEVAETSAKLGVGVVTLGEHVNSARVVLKWGTDPNALSQGKVLDPAALEGAALVETLNGLTANTLYYFSFEATSDAETPETVAVSGSFMTGDPALESAARSKGYPSSVAEGKAVTYDADAAGDPVTLVPGEPCCVVDATGYTYVYHSTVGSGADYVFRNEADFRYNASARIGDKYYLFLSDAVDASAEGDTIELLRNNYAVGELMTIAKRLTIRGNGYVVKVDKPFTDDSGYVDLNCTTDVKTIFQIDNGGDVLLEDMTIMGGGQNVGTGTGAGTHDVHTYAVVVAHEMSGNNNIYQTASTGVLEMRHVTITRSQGGLFTAFGTKVYAENCNLVRNARYCGGGLYNRGFLVMVGSSLSENRSLSSAGGGAAAENQGDMYMNNCVICNNGSTEVGGAINQFNAGNIQTGNGRITRLYLMNSTLTGNFSSWTSNGGGGIGSHSNVACTNLDIYAVNVLLCNNYYYNTANQTLTDSDFFVQDGTTMADNNLLYSVYGRINASSSVTPHVTECWQLSDPSAQSVFKGYTQSARVYEQSKTTAPITGAALESDADQPLARYAPIFDGSLADVGTDGVYTYFDASDWRHEVVKMSYKTNEGTMTALGKCAAASEADIVTTFYESSFAYGVDDREIGIVGASGFGADVRSYTLYLVRNPQNGTVSKNLTLNGMSYPEGSEVTVVATPEFACTFLGWYDETDKLVSDKAAYVFTMDSDKHLYAQFSGPSDTVTLEVDCEQAVKGTHTKFPIKVTTDWLGKAFPAICPNGAVTTETKLAVEAALNAPDSVNGLNHVWQDYVLGGMLPGDEHGRIWIRADQTADKATLRFRMQELAKTQGCGFDVKYRLLAMTPGIDADYNREGAYASSGTFVENITSDQRVHRVIDMIFVPDGYLTSCEYVTTVNTAGVLRVASEKAVEIVSTPWAGFSPSSNPAVAATDYVKASCLSVGDVLYVYDKENSNYLAWSVQENGTWAALDTYLIVNGAVSYVGGADATRTNSLPRGAGAWLERKDPTKPIYLYGQYDPTPATTSLEPGFNLVGSPWSAPFDVSTLTPVASGDRIVIPTGGAPINCSYDATKRQWGWRKSVEAPLKDKDGNPILHPVTKEPLVGVTSEWTTEGLELPVGLGFWYYSADSSASELAWPTAQQ